MLILISPAKKLDYESPLGTELHTQPQFLDHAQMLIDQLKGYEPHDIAELMHLSDKLALLNFERFQDWQQPFTPEEARPAVLAFKGDVYTGMEADTMDEATLEYAQQHLRILSGLYGVLRPLDLMRPYRLEMGTALQNARGKDLYAFWDGIITEKLNADLAESGSEVVVNLASNEYFKSVNKKALNGRLITPAFKDWKNGQYKMISFFAKKARGMMSRYLLEQRVDDAQQITAFEQDGYAFNAELTRNLDEPVFTRRQGQAE
ncbi:MAG: peroxide stress protein YaaA [Thiolinea sp.]